MTYIIAVFRSRTESIRFSDALNGQGVATSLVNTPREVMIGCGVSVRLDVKHKNIAQLILNKISAHSFVGFYLKNEVCGRSVLTKI